MNFQIKLQTPKINENEKSNASITIILAPLWLRK